jgi:AcrR family transcriptional regulator
MAPAAQPTGDIPPRPPADEPSLDARERIIRTAYELFRAHGVNAVGVDRIVADASVAKTTLYRHFRSKDDLVVAVIERHRELWTHGWLEHEVQARGRTPAGRLHAIFDVLDDWFRETSYPGCLFTNTLLETHELRSPIHKAAVQGIEDIYAFLLRLAEEAGTKDPAALAHRIQILMRGSFVAAVEGNKAAVREAGEVARLVLDAEGLVKEPS